MCRGFSDLFFVLPSALAASLLIFWLFSAEADEEEEEDVRPAALDHLVTNSKECLFGRSYYVKKLFAASPSSSARRARSAPAAAGAPAAVCGLDGSATGGGEGKEG